MQEHVKRMVLEHKDLKGKIDRLQEYVYTRGVNEDNKIEYTNICIQLRGYRMAFEALTCRLENNGIVWNDNDEYAEVITDEHLRSIKPPRDNQPNTPGK